MNNKYIIKKPFCLWFTGLSGAGKTTLALQLIEIFIKHEIEHSHLDGDTLRKSLSSDLGFSQEDRMEHNRRVIEKCIEEIEKSRAVLVSLISPFKNVREQARQSINGFVEVHLNVPFEECAKRDVKGLYKKAMAGEIANFTGLTSPYEEPENSEIVLKTHEQTLEESVKTIVDYLLENNYLKYD